jgi:hypothetical protein
MTSAYLGTRPSGPTRRSLKSFAWMVSSLKHNVRTRWYFAALSRSDSTSNRRADEPREVVDEPREVVDEPREVADEPREVVKVNA